MAYPLMTTQNGFNVSQGLQVPLQYVNSSAITGGWFMRFFLLFLWLGVGLSSYFVQIRRKGDANIFSVLAVVGLGVLTFMTMLSVIGGLVSWLDLTIAFILEIVVVLLMFTTNRSQYS